MLEQTPHPPHAWFFSNNWLSINISPRQYQESFNVSSRTLVIPEKAVVGKWDFAPLGRIEYIPERRLYATYNWFKGWDKFFKECETEHILTTGGKPSFFIATGNKRMANFAIRQGFKTVDVNGPAHTIVARYDEFKQHHDANMENLNMDELLARAIQEANQTNNQYIQEELSYEKAA